MTTPAAADSAPAPVVVPPIVIARKDPTPPFLHLVDCPVTINATTGEIEVLMQLHEGARFTVCFDRKQAGQCGLQLMQASLALQAATVSVPAN